MRMYKFEILHHQGTGYVHLDGVIASIRDDSACEFKKNVLKLAVDSIEAAEIGGYEKPPTQKITDSAIKYWDDHIHEHLNELFTRSLNHGDDGNLIDTDAIPLPEIIDDVPDLDSGALYDLIEDNSEKPEFYAETRMTDSFGVSVIDIHTGNDEPGHDSFVRVIAIKLDGEM